MRTNQPINLTIALICTSLILLSCASTRTNATKTTSLPAVSSEEAERLEDFKEGIAAAELPTKKGSQNGIIAYFPLDGDAQDASGNGHHGTIHGASPSSDRHGVAGGALAFDGVDDYVSIPGSEQFNIGDGDASVLVWVVLGSDTQRYVNLISHTNGQDSSDGWWWSIENDPAGITLLQVSIDDQNHIRHLDYPKENWVHLAIVKSGSGIAFYVNGSMIGSPVDHQRIINDSTGELRLGREGSTRVARFGEIYFLGKLDDLRIYNRALTGDEVTAAAGGKEHISEIIASIEATPDLTISTSSPPAVKMANDRMEIVGTWHGTGGDAVYQRFNWDGTCQIAFSEDNLDTPPNVQCTYHFTGTTFTLTETKNNGLPACSSPTGVYEVQIHENGNIQFIEVKDTCRPRARSTAQEHQRVP